MSETVLLAGAGGFIVNILDLVELKAVPKSLRPNFRDFFYWLPFLVWPATGALLAYVYSAAGTQLSHVLALNVGLSAPLVIKSMAAKAPVVGKPIDPGEGA